MNMQKSRLILPIFFILITSLEAAQLCQNTIDDQLENMPVWMKEEARTPLKLPKTCIQKSMNAFRGWAQSLGHDESKNEGLFIFCSEEEIKKSPLPQCQSQTYMNVTTNVYNTVVDCLGIKSDYFYPIVATESGFYHNSISYKELDFGFGQVTHPAIIDVNASWYTYLQKMGSSNKKSCKNILSFIKNEDITPVEDDYRCNLTKAPKNPLLNALYSGLHFKIISGYLEDHIKETNLQKRVEILLGENFTLDRFEEIKSILLMLSYNLGHIGMTLAFDDYLKEQMGHLEKFHKEKRKLSKELALINFQLRKESDQNKRASLFEVKEKAKAALEKQEWTIKWLREPQRFYGDNSPYSFGLFLTKTNRSHYLKILHRRVKYLSQFDKENQCPSTKLFQL